MSDYPDPDEEFELRYGDDLELLNEQDFEDEEYNILPAPKVRKSLDFGTPSKDKLKPQSKTTQKSQSSNLNPSFEDSFREIQNEESHDSNDFSVQPRAEQHYEDISQASSSNLEKSNPKKRNAEELFGDIDDLFDDDFMNEFSEPKRLKADDKVKQDLELIDLIIRKRNEYKSRHNITSVSIERNKLINNIERDKRNLSYELPKYPFIKIKCFDGDSVYVRFHSEEYEKDEMQRIMNENNFQGVMGDNFKEIWTEAHELLSKECSAETQPSSQDVEMLNQHNQEKQLWVDLYKPRKYLELLSDESTNRTMLRWIKLWDKVVFNRNPKIKVAPAVQNEMQKKFFHFNELNTKLDEHGRPEHKVVLLCGPPGLGKTTLAHMVAKHAGYNVVEINASDDRSIDAFRTALENATQMRSVVDQERRPNCIVFDEIDGAPQTSIEFLVKFITGTAPTKEKKTKNKEKTQNILKRPIICICNDVYVPALRPLRQIAFVINFPNTSSARLAERLMEIARRQMVKTDLGAMLALAEKSSNDIRSCLSVLHFFKGLNKPIGLTDVYKTNVGQKDMQKGLFAVWNDIFEIKRSKKATGGSSVASMAERMQKILNTMSSFGDHDRVAQGIFENFPNLNVKDSDLEGTSAASDWFCFNDVISKQIHTVQNYSLMSYLNYAFVIWHFVFASYQKQKINYPSAGYEFRTKETRQKAIVAEVLRGMTPLVRCYNAALPLVMDVLPLLLRIISPPFRPVSLHLYSEEERKNLLGVAGIMTDYNLNYIQERKADGVYQFNLEPNIEDIVIFDKNDDKRRVLSYSNKQLIAREIEMEKMRRFEAQISKKSGEIKSDNSATKEKVAEVSSTKQDPSSAEKAAALPNHLQTLKSKVKSSTPSTSKAKMKIFKDVVKLKLTKTINSIIFSDEATFRSNGAVHRTNVHYYATENPHWVHEVQHQNYYYISINVGRGILNNRIISPYFDDERWP